MPDGVRASPRILVSDDDKLLNAVLADRFRAAGFEVAVDSQSKAVEMAVELQPDLVLLDVHQEVFGLQLLQWLRENPATREIPIVIITSSPTQEHREFCTAMGAVGYAQKPLDEAAIARFARLAVESHQGRWKR